MGSYHTSVQCRGQLQPWDSCREILEEMPATTHLDVFGPGENPAHVELPQGLLSGKAILARSSCLPF